jgi:hypothetical protein
MEIAINLQLQAKPLFFKVSLSPILVGIGYSGVTPIPSKLLMELNSLSFFNEIVSDYLLVSICYCSM